MYDIYTTKQFDFGQGTKRYHFYGMDASTFVEAREINADGTIVTGQRVEFRIPMKDYRAIDKNHSGTFFTKGT